MSLANSTFCIIIGAMKCGTTSLFDLLSRHPQVVASNEKEPHFFTRAEDPISELEEYFAYWCYEPAHHQICLEASTSYTKYPLDDVRASAAAMRASGLNFKFIYIVRNPLERIISHLSHRLSRNEDINRDFLELAILFSSYGTQLTEFLYGFPEAQILVIEFTDFLGDRKNLMQQVQDFLELPHHRFELEGEIHSNASSKRVGLNDASLKQIHDRLHEDMLLFKKLTNFDIKRWGF